MKINSLMIKLFICIFSLYLFGVNHSFSQDSQVIKKIIIDESQNSERLLSPPTENKSNVIKLIPPKSILEKEALRKKIEAEKKAKELEEIRINQEKKRKALQEKKQKEINAARKKQEEKRQQLEEKRKRDLENSRKAEEKDICMQRGRERPPCESDNHCA